MEFALLTTATHESFLRQESDPIEKDRIKSQEIKLLCSRLVEIAESTVTTEGWRSAGLAAIQIGAPLRLFVVRVSQQNSFQIFINPQLEFLGEATDMRDESCLSIPHVTGKVSRHKRIRLTYTDENGNVRTEKYDGFVARVIQHEYDHLNGILFTDKATEVKRTSNF